MTGDRLKLNRSTTIILIAVSLLTLRMALPWIKAPLGYYGYDYGFYVFSANTHSYPDALHKLTSAYQSYSNPLLAFLGSWGKEPLLTSIFVGGFIFLLYLLYANAEVANKYSGKWALLIASSSLPLFALYTEFLFKQLFGGVLFLLGFLTFQQKKYWQSLSLFFLACVFHKTTLFLTCLFFLHIAAVWILKKVFPTKPSLFSAFVVCGAALAIVGKVISESIAVSNTYVFDGILLNQYPLIVVYGLLPLSVPILIAAKQKHSHAQLVLISASITLIFWQLLQNMFYRRTAIFLDFALILLSAEIVSSISNRLPKKQLVLLLIAFLLFYSAALYQTITLSPLITTQEAQEIRSVSQQNEHANIIALSAEDAPWVLAFTYHNRLLAPGLFEDTLTKKQWEEVWRGDFSPIYSLTFNNENPTLLYTKSYTGRPPLETAHVSQNFKALLTTPSNFLPK